MGVELLNPLVLLYYGVGIAVEYITYLPAAKSVPLADPKVDIVTDKGINHAIAPRIRLPNV